MSLRARATIGILLVVTVTLISGALLASTGTNAAQEIVQNETPSTVTIEVAASGRAEAPPDEAVVDLAVVANADTAEAARRMVAENVSRVRAALQDLDVSDDRVRTTAFSLNEVRNEDGTVSYQAAHGLEVTVPADQAGTVVDAAVASGANRVSGVRFTLAEDTRQELRHEAIRRALANARADADVIANETGVAVDYATAVSTSDVGFDPVGVAIEARSGETTLDPGPVTVHATVSVTYRAS